MVRYNISNQSVSKGISGLFLGFLVHWFLVKLKYVA